MKKQKNFQVINCLRRLVTRLKEQDIHPVELMAKQRIAVLDDDGRMLSKCGELVHMSFSGCGANMSVPKF